MKNGMVFALTLFLFSPIALAQSPLDLLTAGDLADGERLFRVHCARCHGIDGAGGEGSNLARPSLQYANDDEDLIALIDDGIPGTGMPAIWSLDDAQTSESGRLRANAWASRS